MSKVLLKRVCGLTIDGVFTQTDYLYDTVSKSTSSVFKELTSNTCSIYSKPTTEIVHEFCSGTTRHTKYHDGEGGVTTVKKLQSVACGFVDSLSIYQLNLTHETLVGNNDGTVEILVGTTYDGTVQYSLDNFLTFKTSNKYTRLRPGDYIAYARASDGSVMDMQPFTIKPGPTPDPKYKIEYTDALGSLTEIKIHQKGFTGTTEILKGGSDPLILSYREMGDDLYTTIKPLQAGINIIAEEDFKFTEIFQASEKDFSVEVLKDGQIKFKGFILPDVYQEPYLHPPFEVSLSATDGLSILSNYPLSGQNNTDIIDRKTVMEYISLILNKLELQLNIVSHVNLYEDSMLQDELVNDPFVQASISPEAFLDDDGNFIDCRAALDLILAAFNARIYQDAGKWHIVRIPEAGNVHNVREFDSQGKFLSSYSVDTLRYLNNPSEEGNNKLLWIERSQLLQYRPAYKRIKTIFDRGRRYTFLPHGYMEAGDWTPDNKLKGWNGTLEYRRVSTNFDINSNSNYFASYLFGPDDKRIEYDMYIPGSATSLADATVIRSQPFYLDRDLVSSMFLSVESRDDLDRVNKVNPQLYMELNCGSYYYDMDANTWTTTQTFNNLISIDFLFSFNSYRPGGINIPAPPVPGLAQIKLFQTVSADYNIDGLRIAFFIIFPNKGVASPRLKDISMTNPKSFTMTNEHVVKLGDVENGVVHNGTIWVGNNYAQEWGKYPLLQKNTIDRFNQLYQTKQFLTGTIRGKLSFGDVINPKNTESIMLCLGYTNNDKKCTYDGEWIEIVTTGRAFSKGDFLIDYQGDYVIDNETNKVKDY